MTHINNTIIPSFSLELHCATREEYERIIEYCILKLVQEIMEKVLIPKLQPDADIEIKGMPLRSDVLQYVMLNYGQFQKVFIKVFEEIFCFRFGDILVNLHSALLDYLTVFDREMMVALAGGRPKDPSERNAGAELDAVIDGFAERMRSFQCPPGKESPDQ